MFVVDIHTVTRIFAYPKEVIVVTIAIVKMDFIVAKTGMRKENILVVSREPIVVGGQCVALKEQSVIMDDII